MPDDPAAAGRSPARHARSLQAAFSFLTRLGPAKIYASAEMQGCPAWFPVVGIAVGALLWLIASCAARMSSQPGTAAALLAALLVTAADMWLTRGLHYDAAADICDAMGSGARGPRFAEILKDSRLGAFGGMGLAVAVLARLLSVAALLLKGNAAALIPACCLGRVFLLLPPAFLEPAPWSSLGAILRSPSAKPRFWAWLAAAAVLCFLAVPLPACLAAAVMCAFFSVLLVRTAAREGGYNGDFAGALCLACESSVLFCAALFG